MLIYVIAAFLVIGFSKCEGDVDCASNQAMICLEPLLSLDLVQLDEDNEADLKEFCSKAKSTVDCFRTLTDRCHLPEESLSGFNEALEELESKFSEACSGQSSENGGELDSEEVMECFEHVEADMAECVEEVVPQVLTMFQNQDIDENKIKCTTFSLMIDCATQKIGNRCGEHIASLFEEAVKEDIPDTFKDCDLETEVSVFNLL